MIHLCFVRFLFYFVGSLLIFCFTKYLCVFPASFSITPGLNYSPAPHFAHGLPVHILIFFPFPLPDCLYSTQFA